MVFPQISIITPSLNREGHIKKAIESVIAQNYPAVEHIVADGGSTDGTLNLLAKYVHLHVVSAPDLGVYDALNKGIRMASGEIIGQLNSDDYYEPGVFAEVADYFREHPEIDAICARARTYKISKDGDEETVLIYPAANPGKLFYYATIGGSSINAWFFRKNVFEQLGYYSLDYPIVADREFLFRVAKGNINFHVMEEVVYHYLQHDGSFTFNSNREKQIRYMKELSKLAERLVVVEGAASEIGLMCLSWHADLSGRLCTKILKSMDFRLLNETVSSAFKYNPWWPIEFLEVHFLGKWKNRDVP